MQEVFKKIIEKLEELKQIEKNRPDECDENGNGDGEQIYEDGRSQGRFEQTVRIIKIVKQVAAEYNNGWIPCSERLPERDGAYQLKEFEVTVDNGERIYTSHATYDFQNEKWLVHKKKVIAWKQPCEPYQPKGE